MKKSFISYLFILCALSTLNCSKGDNSDGEGGGKKYYVKFETDGVKKEYSGVTIMSLTRQDDYYMYQFTGTKAVNDIEGMTMVITTDKAITPPQNFKTENWTSASNVTRVELLLGIHDEEKNTFVSFVAPGYDFPATATITEITNDHVKGNFSGVVTNSGFTKSKVITNGEFYFKILR